MSLNIRKISYFLLAALCFFSSVALPAAEGEKNGTLPPLDPLSLEHSWWAKYFSVESPELEERIQLVLSRLSEIPSSLSVEEVEVAQVLLERIRVQLNALPQAKSQAIDPPTASRVFLKTYPIDRYLDLSELLRSSEFELLALKEELKERSRRVDLRLRHIEGLFRRYEQIEQASSERFLLGLEIIAHRAALALSQQQVRILKEQVARDDEQKFKLKSEIEYAEKHLDFRVFSVEQLNTAVSRARRDLERAQQRLLDAEAEAVKALASEQRAERHYEAQLVVSSAVERVIALTKLRQAELLRTLYLFVNGQLGDEMIGLTQRIEEWNEQSLLSEVLAREWEGVSESERDRAARAYTLAIESDEASERSKASLHKRRSELAQSTLSSIEVLRSQEFRAQLLANQLNKQVGETKNILQRSLRYVQGWISQGWKSVEVLLTYRLTLIGEVPITALGLLRVLIILLCSYWFSHITRAALGRLQERRETALDPSTLYSLGRLVHYAILFCGLIIALASIGLNFQNLAIVAGALSVGIGFGLQSIVNNFLGGLIILFERSLKVGDYIELESGCRGHVSQIWVRSTVIRTNDGLDVVIPNAEIIGNRLINWTMDDIYCRMHIKFNVAYGTDKEKVREVVKEAANRVPRTLKGLAKYRDPDVWLVSFGDSSLNFELVVWVNAYASKHYASTYAAYMWEIETALSEAGIVVPFPQQDIYIKSAPRDWIN